jgi:hypothetical protein
MGYMQEDLISVLSWNVNNVEQEWDGVAQWGYGIWQIGEESGSAMNPGSCLKDDMLHFASIDAVMNDSLQIVSARSTIAAEEM